MVGEVEPGTTLLQLLLAIASVLIWAAVWFRRRREVARFTNAQRLFVLAVIVLIGSEFIPFTVDWTVGGVYVADVLRGIRSGVVLIVGLAYLTMPHQRPQ